MNFPTKINAIANGHMENRRGNKLCLGGEASCVAYDIIATKQILRILEWKFSDVDAD